MGARPVALRVRRRAAPRVQEKAGAESCVAVRGRAAPRVQEKAGAESCVAVRGRAALRVREKAGGGLRSGCGRRLGWRLR